VNILNAGTTKKWPLDGLAAQGVSDTGKIVKKHIVAVSTAGRHKLKNSANFHTSSHTGMNVSYGKAV